MRWRVSGVWYLVFNTQYVFILDNINIEELCIAYP